MTELLTIDQVAQRLAVSVKTIRRLDIPRVRLEGQRLMRYRPEDVDAYIRARLESGGIKAASKPSRRPSKRNGSLAVSGVIAVKTLLAMKG